MHLTVIYFQNLEDLTSEDSIDDVFEDDSILEVSIDGVRRFRRQNVVRRKLPVKHKQQKTLLTLMMKI